MRRSLALLAVVASACTTSIAPAIAPPVTTIAPVVDARVEAPAPAVEPSGDSASGSIAIGQPVFVEWRSAFWKAKVIAQVDGRRVMIHYDGYGEEWDEVVGPPRVRLEVPLSSRQAIGDAMFVEWQGAYWLAQVRAIEAGDRVRIHYDGYGPEWDEVVGADRMKRLEPLGGSNR